MKNNVTKVRAIADGKVLTAFAGSTADCVTLVEMLEGKIMEYPNSLPRAAVELTRSWRMDRMMSKFEATMLVADSKHQFIGKLGLVFQWIRACL